MRVTVVAPTLNEEGNIVNFLTAVCTAMPFASVLVVDDRSTDNTIVNVIEFSQNHPQVEILVRTESKGLGSSYREGFAKVLAGDVEIIVSMDADLSHDPAAIPALVAAVEAGADMAIGSRYVKGGSCVGWPLHRRLLSKAGNAYTRSILGLQVQDCTSGFRAYRASTLRSINPAATKAEGYAFLTEIVTRTAGLPLEIAEVPIAFVDRKNGKSKMSIKIILESMLLVTRWGIRFQLRGRYQ
ncbi:unannotated protein [freshwater metagenome]|uniref:Unannotated protein n=1 Tax=freshwater metagenome TaxID=449393 RepID=A0A6J6FQU4_9ZZZZ